MDDHFNSTLLPVGAVPYHEHRDKRFPSCDEQCIPKSLPHDLSEFSNLFGTQTTTHYDKSHDDACLDRNGCPGLGLDAGIDVNKASHVFEFWDRSEASASFPFPLSNMPPVDRSFSGGCSMTLSLSDDCCNSSCLDEDACSTGTCDPDTFCRDENCPRPQVGHDVAHGATILQEISGAKPDQQHLDTSNQSSEVSTSEFPYTPQSMEQPHSFPFEPEYPDSYYAENIDSFGSAPDGQQGHNGASHPPQGYPETLHTSSGFHTPQTTPLESPAQYAPVPLHHSQSFSVMQQLRPATTTSVFPIGPYNPEHTFGNAFGQAHTQETPWTYHSSSINPNYTGPLQWSTDSGSLSAFDFNSPLTGQTLVAPYGQHSLNGDLSSRTDLIHRPVSQGQPTPCGSLESATATPSPTSELSIYNPQKHDFHTCQWKIDGDKCCEERFSDSRALYHHIAEAHIDALHADGQDGFMCCWAGCSRQTDERYEGKRGFIARSKLKRHLIIHTGPVDSFICQICGKSSPSAQALNTHLVTHSEERPHICDVGNCKKAFKTADSLKVHKQNVHSDHKPYLCLVCGKRFKDSSNFSKHKATHSNEKPWSCKTCKESFARRDQLHRHARKMHDISRKDLEVQYPKRLRGSCT